MFISSLGVVEEISESQLKKIKKHRLQDIHSEMRDFLQRAGAKRKILENAHFWGTFWDINCFFSMSPSRTKLEMTEKLHMTWHKLDHLLKYVDLRREGEERFDEGELDTRLDEIAGHLEEVTGWDPRTRYVNKKSPFTIIY